MNSARVNDFSSTLASALSMVARGFKVFRIVPNGKDPWADGINEATGHVPTMEQWFRSHPNLNYGIPTDGHAVLDLDPRKNPEGWVADYLSLGPIPHTLQVLTPSGGTHIWFSGFEAGQRAIAETIDVRGKGGYVVGPGSVINGKVYKIVVDAPPAPVPDAIKARLSRPGERLADNTTPLVDLDTPAALAWGEAFARTAPAAVEGDRNTKIHLMACTLKDGGLSRETTLELLREHWCPRCNPPYDEQDRIERTVDSAYNNGERRPGCYSPDIEFESVADDPDLAEHMRRRGPREAPQPGIIRATPFPWIDPAAIPPREWIYGRHLVRKFISATIAPGGVGKSSLVLVEALSIVTGRRLLARGKPEAGRVWIWNGEDPYEELQRRIMAACLHYRISPDDIAGRLFVDSGRTTPIVIAVQARDGVKIAVPVVDQVKAQIRTNAIDVVEIDPFVSSHRVSENDNNAIEAVAWEWAKIADECNCAIELVHHARKTGGAEVTVEDGRGASALRDKARAMRVLNSMSREEGEKAGVENHRLYFRVDDGKASMAPPSDVATWYRLESVGLGNATGRRPQDEVGVVVPWKWPDAFDGLPDDALTTAQAAIAEGRWREDPQSGEWAGYSIARALGLDPEKGSDRDRVKTLLSTWLKQGAFETYTAKDRHSKDKSFVRPLKSGTPAPP
jgi:hypothetical protein